jgi:hypothetical protein
VESLLASGVKIYMVVPMIAGGQLMGAISFGGEDADFAVEHIAIAREVATQLAIAITQAGLLGLEIDHRDNPEEGRKYLRALAERHDLIVTGSSDYHGRGKPNLLGENTTAPEMLRRILSAGTGSSAVGMPDVP